MWKFIILLGTVYVLYKLFANDFFKKKKEMAKAEKEELERKQASGEMVKDPECGTWVSVDNSISVRDGDKVYHFCSYECRDKYLKALENGGRVLPNLDDKSEM